MSEPLAPAAGIAALPRSIKWLLAGSLGAMVAAASLFVHAMSAPPAAPPLPVLAALPGFTLTDQTGKPSGLAELRGQVFVADFVFTRCPTACPLLTQKMGQIAARTSALDGFQLVSISVDPDYDTPEVLRRYMEKHAIDARRWRFLTGPLGDIEQVVTGGFKEVLERGKQAGPEAFMGIVHGGHLVLVDKQGRIRGYYDSNEPQAIDDVVRDAQRLLAE